MVITETPRQQHLRPDVARALEKCYLIVEVEFLRNFVVLRVFTVHPRASY